MEKSMKNYRLAVDENGSPFVLNSKGSIDFRTRYSKNKKIIHSASEVRTSSPAEDDLLPNEDIV